MDIGAVGKVQAVGPVAGGVRDVGSAVLDEARVEIRLGAIERPTHTGHPVDEHATIAATAVDVVGTEHYIVVEFEMTERVVTAEIHMALAMEVIGHLRGDIDRRCGHRTHLGDPVREARDHPGGGARHRGLRSRKRAEQIPQAKPFEGVVVDQVERKLGVHGEPVVELRVHTRLLAVVVIVLRAIVPDIGGRRRGVLKIARRAEEPDGLLAEENIQRHTEITLVAQHIEDFLIADIEQRMGPMLLAQRNLLGVWRSDARGKIIGDAPFFLHAQGGAALEIDRAAQRAGLLVGCMALGNLERFKHRTRHGVHARGAGHAALRAHQRAVDRDGVHRRRHAAHREPDDIALVAEIAGDTGQEHGELARVHVG